MYICRSENYWLESYNNQMKIKQTFQSVGSYEVFVQYSKC
ncbi:hypothetical protein SC08_Contig83orf02175 [Clostridium butyricum]|nr:hypothetical protein SC08_Contig83orf02175 [Clostridium butyricum]